MINRRLLAQVRPFNLSITKLRSENILLKTTFKSVYKHVAAAEDNDPSRTKEIEKELKDKYGSSIWNTIMKLIDIAIDFFATLLRNIKGKNKAVEKYLSEIRKIGTKYNSLDKEFPVIRLNTASNFKSVIRGSVDVYEASKSMWNVLSQRAKELIKDGGKVEKIKDDTVFKNSLEKLENAVAKFDEIKPEDLLIDGFELYDAAVAFRFYDELNVVDFLHDASKMAENIESSLKDLQRMRRVINDSIKQAKTENGSEIIKELNESISNVVNNIQKAFGKYLRIYGTSIKLLPSIVKQLNEGLGGE